MRYELTEPFRSCNHPEARCTSQDNWSVPLPRLSPCSLPPPLPSTAQRVVFLHNRYDVPFGVMLPKRGQASNLMVPVAISSTSIAYSSTRIEGMWQQNLQQGVG
jgi:hypothetical protein